ncbi:hypothetical protein CVT26_008091 [Gymnopilus dilepis]|uniref:Uncharacterized protein n=1 Tax=Gymnopilus dilepis TaxID=231916 RepID=A0A409WFC4_9AGAR|nr:hypothetical protein CVT26_008091 [Gymnopilus dilepis]
MVNPGAFKGVRKLFLMGEKEAYSQAVEDGYIVEAVARTQRRFFKRFPIDLPDEIEPSPEELAKVDDEEIEIDYPEPDREKLSEEEYEAAVKALEERRKRVAFKKGQIKRWLAYQYQKDHDVDTKFNGAHNPYRALLFKLTGHQFVRPRAKTACNVWRKTMRAEIEEKVKAKVATESIGRGQLAALRDKIAREMFCDLPAEERRKWSDVADKESREALKAWEEEINSPPSKAPEARQKCILGLVRFVQPILDLICEATGWKASFIAGGPEPAHDGKLNVIGIHSGKTSGDVPMDFGALEREAIRKTLIPMYGRFLKRCYSVEECHARALKSEDSLSMESAGLELEGATLFGVDSPYGSVDEKVKVKDSDEKVKIPEEIKLPKPRKSAKAPPQKPSPTMSITPTRGPSNPAPQPASQPPPPRAHSVPRSIPDEPPPYCGPPDAPSPPNSPPISRAASVAPAPSNSVPIAPAQVIPPSPPRSLPPSPAPSPPPSPPDSMPSASTLSATSSAVSAPSDSMQLVSTSSTSSSAATTPPDSMPSTSPVPSPSLITALAATTSISKATRRSKRRRSNLQDSAADLGTPPSKKAKSGRTTRSSAALSANCNTEPSPKWFADTLAMLRSPDLNKHPLWVDTVDKWAAFEAKEGYEGAERLSPSFRPDAIGAWIQRRRSANYRPPIDVPAYSAAFTKWWTTLQPGWRVLDDEVLVDKVDGDWSSLRRPGLNGMVSVLVALFYWGCAVDGDAERVGDWQLAVKDCLLVLSHLQ